MNKRLLELYEVELQHIRHVAAEFAREHPKIAGRLSLDPDGTELCPDPFVERLLEGFAFLTARVQLKLDAEFPRFTQGLLETVYPHYLAPVPAMGIVRFEPENAPPTGELIPRGTLLRTIPGRDEVTACTFRTAHPVRVLPLRVVEARYYSRDLGELDLPETLGGVKAAVRLRLEVEGDDGVSALQLDDLTFFLAGSEDVPHLLYEQLVGHALPVDGGAPADPATEKHRQRAVVGRAGVEQVGFGEEEALLPTSPRTFEGYRLLREYFALPQRCLFLRLKGLRAAAPHAQGRWLDIVVPLDQVEPRLERRVEAGTFALYCTPVINLFSKQLDEVTLTDDQSGYPVIPDRTRPLDFEVFDLEEVEGVGELAGQKQLFRPFYWTKDTTPGAAPYYTVRRSRRHLTAQERLYGAHSEYLGMELSLELVDRHNAPYTEPGSPFKKLRIRALCTNRHLPIQLAARERDRQRTDFDIVGGAVGAIRFVLGPTAPMSSFAEGDFAWRLISHLSLNYLSLLDDGEQGASALREMMHLYVAGGDPALHQQIESLRSVMAEPVVERLPQEGPIALTRGLRVTLCFDERGLRGTGCFLLGAVLDRFLSKYVSINSFTRAVVRAEQTGELMQWPARIGKRVIL